MYLHVSCLDHSPQSRCPAVWARTRRTQATKKLCQRPLTWRGPFLVSLWMRWRPPVGAVDGVGVTTMSHFHKHENEMSENVLHFFISVYIRVCVCVRKQSKSLSQSQEPKRCVRQLRLQAMHDPPPVLFPQTGCLMKGEEGVLRLGSSLSDYHAKWLKRKLWQRSFRMNAITNTQCTI